MAKLGGKDDGKVMLLDDDLSAMQEEGQQGARPVAFKPAAAPQNSAPGNSAQDAAAMEQAYKRQQANNSSQAARDLQAEERAAALREQSKQPPERTDAERKADYNASREWLTKHGQEYAKEEMYKIGDKASKFSHIVKDLRWVASADPSKMTMEERNALARKKIQLADILISSPPADIAAFAATLQDIYEADVSTWRKAGAHAANGVGLVGGMVPVWGSAWDVGSYEAIGRLLESQGADDVGNKSRSQ